MEVNFCIVRILRKLKIFLIVLLKKTIGTKKKHSFSKKHLKAKFKDFKLATTQKTKDADFLFTTCESLIANDGSLLISSNQIAEKKLIELPENFIVFATTSQLVNTISEGLQGIKAQSRKKIPSNITTIKHFKANDTNDFLSYGSSTKNLYLLLLEDL